ncbi:hypothetical protein LSH36_401g00061 [Paralvinella palmiformis]|uniref:Transposase Helix-turn-helix domain-containing protein n=1 Tax=Paralvinella palmiformis TaxID=53620 RepID=A0AAD9JDV7_9ANNE|nr:hypothetical protein LSH36_401g00061 [Paralvinella palmiformis]
MGQSLPNSASKIVDQDVDMVDESVIVIDSSIEMLHVEEVETVAEKTTTTQGVQTNAGLILLESSSQTGSDPNPSNRMTAAAYKNNPRGIQFYTGIDNYVIFRDVFASLGPATTRLNYMYGVPNLDPEDHFFLTLMKLRTYKTNFELSMHFLIPECDVYIIFVTWIRFMSLQWRELTIWPEKEIVHCFCSFRL